MKCELCGIKIDKVHQLIVPPEVVGIKSRYDPILIKLPMERNLKVLKVCKKCLDKEAGK